MFTINVSAMKGVQLVETVGRLDGESAQQFAEVLDRLVDTGRTKIALDLSSLEYISSPGLREIVRVYKRAHQGDGDIRIINPNDRVRAVFELAGLDTLLAIFATPVEAIRSF